MPETLIPHAQTASESIQREDSPVFKRIQEKATQLPSERFGEWTLNQIAEWMRSAPTPVEVDVVGDGNVSVSDLVHPRMVTAQNQLILAIEPEVVAALSQLPAVAAVVAAGVPLPEGLPQKGFLVVQRPRYALATLLEVFARPTYHAVGIHPMAVVHQTASIHPSVNIGPFVTVGPEAQIDEGTVLLANVTVGAGCKIGKHCLLHPGVRLGDAVMLGNRVIVQHNASIGGDGFSYVTPEKGSIESAKESGGKIEAQNTEIVRINSIGTVLLEDDVEVGANACIDRSTLGVTRIGKGTKIDNLVQIAHNCTVGENAFIVSQVGIAGSTKIGDRAVLAGQVGIGDHRKIGNDAIVMAQSGVMDDIPEKTVVCGTPAIPQREFFQTMAHLYRQKQVSKEVKQLRKELEAMKVQLESLQQP